MLKNKLLYYLFVKLWFSTDEGKLIIEIIQILKFIWIITSEIYLVLPSNIKINTAINNDQHYSNDLQTQSYSIE